MGRRTVKIFSPKILLVLLLLCNSSCMETLRERIELYVSGYNTIKTDGVIYVSINDGNDKNPGTQEYPKKTIQNAIDLAANILDTGEIRVSEGTYNISEALVIRDGISVSGGYSRDNWRRDITLHATAIVPANIEKTVIFEEGVTQKTVIDGLTIKTSWIDTVAAIYCKNASPTIRFNNIDAGLGMENSVGIFCISSSPIIDGNTINAGKGNDSSWGIANVGSSPGIRNNVIFGEGSSGQFRGIINSESSEAIIQNNTIDGRSGSNAVSIYNSYSRSIIENNILYAAGNCCGIYEVNPASLPIRVNSNDFYNYSPIYDYVEGACASIAELVAYLIEQGVPVSGNKDDDPLFVDEDTKDFHLQSDSPIKGNGINLSSYFTTDRDGITRTLWSIGAYE